MTTLSRSYTIITIHQKLIASEPSLPPFVLSNSCVDIPFRRIRFQPDDPGRSGDKPVGLILCIKELIFKRRN